MTAIISGNIQLKGLISLGLTPIIPPDWSSPLEQILLASDTEAGDQFGFSVSISSDGNTAIIGAKFEGTIAGGAGAAYVYTRTGDTWAEQQKIQASDADVNDRFGHSVSISGDGNTCIVGALDEDTVATGAGAAYIFTRSGSVWTEQQKIQAGDADTNDHFGVSVSISSDGITAIIGSYLQDTGGASAGAAYIFTESGGTWTEQQKIQASDKQAADEFGISVSISGDGSTTIVGAHFEDTGGTSAGAAYIFTRSGSVWTEQQKLLASNAGANDNFGVSVSISSDSSTTIIGARYEDTGATNTGAAYIFTESGGVWTEQQKLTASDAQASDSFGNAVSISSDGSTTIVGARLEDAGGTSAGAAYVFAESGGTWTEQIKLTASDAQASDEFGASVAISGDGGTGIIGAPLEDTGGSSAGAAYSYIAS